MDGRPASRQRRSWRTSTSVKGAGKKREEDDGIKEIHSIFRSPSVEKKLAQAGIDLSGGGLVSWKLGGGGGEDKTGGDSGGRRSARHSGDLGMRIQGISSSMEEYDKKIRNVTETMQNARRRLRESPGDDSGDSVGDLEEDDFLEKCRESLKKDLMGELRAFSLGGDRNNNEDDKDGMGDLGTGTTSEGGTTGSSTPRRLFGLDAQLLLESSSSGDDSSEEEETRKQQRRGKQEEEDISSSEDSSEEEQPTKMKISIRPPAPTSKAAKSAALKRFQENVKNKKPGQSQPQKQRSVPQAPGKGRRIKKKEPDDMLPPRSLSPIMPSVPDKQFHTMLERREERVSRHLTTMKNELAQLNHKVEMDKRKANEQGGGARGVMPHSYQGRPMRLMKPGDKEQAELNSFVQTTGGQAGGWERKDHNTFLRIFDVWRKHPQKLMENLKKDMPHKKPKEIAEHIKWFERFEQLSSQNRQSVHQWNQEKRRENELIYQMGSASQRAKLEGDKRRQEHLRRVREQERDRGKEKLAQWKRTHGVVRSVTSATSSGHPPPITPSIEPSVAGSDEPLDIAGVRQHILDITAKVHALDNPKRDFRPPRAPPSAHHHPHGHPPHPPPRGERRRGDLPHAGDETTQKLGAARTLSYTSVLSSRPPTPPQIPPAIKPPQRLKLPEIEPEPPKTRPTSSSTIRPPSGSLLHQQQQRNRRIIQEFRERDSRLIEVKKKAVEIARERRKSKISQLTAEDIKRRIRSRVGSGGGDGSSPSFLNPTKQSELRKTLTHLERLEMLSKHDLNSMGVQGAVGGSELGAGDATAVLMLNNLPSKGIPSWRRPAGSDYF